jgi:hypothetical protein
LRRGVHRFFFLGPGSENKIGAQADGGCAARGDKRSTVHFGLGIAR